MTSRALWITDVASVMACTRVHMHLAAVQARLANEYIDVVYRSAHPG